MNRWIVAVISQCKRLMLDENGQDLVEYALVIASLAFAATAGMSQLANGINSSFSSVAGLLTIA